MGKVQVEFQLPERLQRLLAKDKYLAGIIYKAASDFSSWFADNKTPFFPEYTDHGVAHITNVLASAEELISKDAWERITPGDTAAIFAAVMLHDCAMHLTLDGFRALLRWDPKFKTRFEPKQEGWSDLFDKFVQEASRWDINHLQQIFGSGRTEPVPDPRTNLNSISDDQKLLIGEFLRRHHARLAHEIALNGVPNVSDSLFDPFAGAPLELRDLYGFLAYSHNVSIRYAVDRLPLLSRPICLDVHAPFVMALLRIADYIQIDDKRADKRVLNLRSLRSPVSRVEWAKHDSVRELHAFGNDPESLTVVTIPAKVEEFVGMRRLLLGIQQELDESWAVLGEIYGRLPDLSELGITVRRLRSSIDDPVEFSHQYSPQYVPKDIRLEAASAELLELLVRPLYGKRPTVGVRELLQNATDATIERSDLHGRHSLDGEYLPHVSVSMGSRFLCVKDNGVGMTLSTIENFFLRVGASFRRSDWWKREFTDSSNASTISRSGRFGVGALAAFLIGGRISVITRHFSDETGLGFKFDVELSNNLIEVFPVVADIGTTISVEIDPANFSELLYPENDPAFDQWYLLEAPNVTFEIDESLLTALDSHDDRERPKAIPADPSTEGWIKIDAPGFDRVYWSYEVGVANGYYANKFPKKYQDSFIACNGIYVCGTHGAVPKITISESDLGVGHPALIAWDPDGRLPLNLQRSGIAESTYPFQDALASSISDHYVDHLLNLLVVTPALPRNLSGALLHSREVSKYHSGRGHYGWAQTLIALTEDGWLPCEPELLRSFKDKYFAIELATQGRKLALENVPPRLLSKLVLLPAVFDSSGSGAIKSFIRGIIDGDQATYRSNDPLGFTGSKSVGGLLLVRKNVLASFAKAPKMPKRLLEKLETVSSTQDWVAYRFGNATLSKGLISDALGWVEKSEASTLAICRRSSIEPPREDSPFMRSWLKKSAGCSNVFDGS